MHKHSARWPTSTASGSVASHGPFGSARLDSRQLADWYQRHGFKVTESDTDTYIDREPVTSIMLPS